MNMLLDIQLYDIKAKSQFDFFFSHIETMYVKCCSYQSASWSVNHYFANQHHDLNDITTTAECNGHKYSLQFYFQADFFLDLKFCDHHIYNLSSYSKLVVRKGNAYVFFHVFLN